MSLPETKRQIDLFNAIDQAVIATDAAGKITYWSPAAALLYGWRDTEVIGRQVVDVVTTEMSREKAASIMESLAAGEIWSGVFPVRDRSGKAFKAAVTDLPIVRGDQVIGVLGVSKPDESASLFVTLLSDFARGARQLWPDQIDLSLGPGLDHAVVNASDPHILQLLSLLLMREIGALDRRESVHISAALTIPDTVFMFGLPASSKPSVYVRVGGFATVERAANLRDAMRSTHESHYAARLVKSTGGRLFVGATAAAPSATHLFLPLGI